MEYNVPNKKGMTLATFVCISTNLKKLFIVILLPSPTPPYGIPFDIYYSIILFNKNIHR